jgi:D-alanyl-lipoteichoic acid acyltransferase DltB (MBOAT superfamily)
MFFVPVYILILAFTIIVDYIAAILIEKSKGKKRKRWLLLSISANVGVLAFFKYYNFLNDNLTAIFTFLKQENPIPYLNIILPIGLSFHTFQAMSYTIEVYRGHQSAERHFGIFALYVMFYPQLVAGPIERPYNLLHQFYEKHYFDYQRMVDGLKLMCWGFFKKVVIADRIAPLVDAVYSNPENGIGLAAFIATALFAFQVYCDFSGYSDIAIGSAWVMGFRLMKNFNVPFFSTRLSELWKRWHISLTSWFKDYVYIPLGGNRVSKGRWYLNLVLTFSLSGLWHGANWTYIIWGAMQGVFLAISAATENKRKRFNSLFGSFQQTALWKIWQQLMVFVLFCSGLVFFRSTSLENALLLIQNGLMISSTDFSFSVFRANPYEFINGIIAILFLLGMEKWMGNRYIFEAVKGKPSWFNWTLFALLTLVIIHFGVFHSDSFIYFQF